MLNTFHDQYCRSTHSVTIKGAQKPRDVLTRPVEPARMYLLSDCTAVTVGPHCGQRIVSVSHAHRISGAV